MKTVLVFAFAVIAATNAASAGAPKIKPGDEFASTKVQKIMRLAKKFAPLIPAKVFLADYSCSALSAEDCLNDALAAMEQCFEGGDQCTLSGMLQCSFDAIWANTDCHDCICWAMGLFGMDCSAP